MPNEFSNQGGVLPILILLASLGILGFLLISNTFSFRDTLFNRLFPKPPSSAQETPPPSIPDEILLKFAPGVPETTKENIRISHGIKVEEVIKQIDVERGKVPAEARDRIIEALNNNPNILYVGPNYIGESSVISNDPLYPNQWALPKVLAPQAWDFSTGSSSVVTAVIDTGLYSEHEDFQGKVVQGYNFYDNNTNTLDVHGHGTAVSGVIGANTNNNKGIAAMSWFGPIMPIRDTDTGGYFTTARIINSISYAADNGAKVINISQGGYNWSEGTVSLLNDAITYAWNKGLVIVAAAGNCRNSDNTEAIDCKSTDTITYPARLSFVVAVGSSDKNDTRVNSSRFGPELDVVAPGVSIHTTCDPVHWKFLYCNADGTSFASPHTAGLAALIFSANTSLTNQQVVDIIKNTADDKGAVGWDDQYGWGRINAYKALLAATGQPIPSPTPAPSPTPTPTSSPTSDTVVISNISSTTTANSATIKWTTNIPSTSRVSYGTTIALGSSTTEDINLVISHSVIITGLPKQTRYYFKVHSKNSAGLESSSPTVSQFRTKNR